jgi:hypothetical protein
MPEWSGAATLTDARRPPNGAPQSPGRLTRRLPAQLPEKGQAKWNITRKPL